MSGPKKVVAKHLWITEKMWDIFATKRRMNSVIEVGMALGACGDGIEPITESNLKDEITAGVSFLQDVAADPFMLNSPPAKKKKKTSKDRRAASHLNDPQAERFVKNLCENPASPVYHGLTKEMVSFMVNSFLKVNASKEKMWERFVCNLEILSSWQNISNLLNFHNSHLSRLVLGKQVEKEAVSSCQWEDPILPRYRDQQESCLLPKSAVPYFDGSP
jgi:hypothetical protein